MPRQLRYFLAGIPQHVVVRGVDQQATFFAKDDYRLFKRALLINAERYGAAIHAYVLMTNHVHLLLTPLEKRSIPQILQGMGRDYVQRINWRYDRSGTLWQGRYKASLVQDDSYLLHCQRYVELNPIRSGMVSDPGDYPYSSYRYNAFDEEDPIVTPHLVYLQLGSDATRHKNYRDLFRTEMNKDLVDSIRKSTNSCRVLGSNKFKDQIETMLQRRVRPAKVGRPQKNGIP